MKKGWLKLSVIFSIISVVTISCVHEIPISSDTTNNGGTGGTGNGGTGTNTCDTSSFNYSTVINPLVQTFCVSCHGATTANTSGAGIDLSTYAKLMPYVTNGRFFGSINSSAGYSAMPKGGIKFSSCQITQVKKWIAAGAKNDTATGPSTPPISTVCDTANFLYSTTIAPLLQTNCNTCHSAGNPNNGGIDLTTFANAQAFALNGRLYGSIAHTAGYSAMPKGMSQLSACNITQVRKWIAAGALNDLGTTPTTPTTPPTTSNCSPDTVYFQNTIAPLIGSTCSMSGCHDAITKASGVTLVTYSNIMSYVSVGNASSSKLYKVMVKTGNEKMPLPPVSPMTATQITQVQTWINQGAKNNVCSSCDTTKYTYSLDVAPLLTTSCVGCHGATSAASSGGGIDLSTYAQVKVYATNGRLYGSIAHTAGYSAMPKNLAQMPACQIIQIKKWIDAGSLNN